MAGAQEYEFEKTIPLGCQRNIFTVWNIRQVRLRGSGIVETCPTKLEQGGGGDG